MTAKYKKTKVETKIEKEININSLKSTASQLELAFVVCSKEDSFIPEDLDLASEL